MLFLYCIQGCITFQLKVCSAVINNISSEGTASRLQKPFEVGTKQPKSEVRDRGLTDPSQGVYCKYVGCQCESKILLTAGNNTNQIKINLFQPLISLL